MHPSSVSSKATVSPRGELVHMSGATDFMTANQEVPLDHLALEGGSLVFLGPTGLTIRKAVHGCYPQ